MSNEQSDTTKLPVVDLSDKDAVVHAICPYLHNFKDCKKCPEWETDEKHGPWKRGCYHMAEEVINICQTGNPWRKTAQDGARGSRARSRNPADGAGRRRRDHER